MKLLCLAIGVLSLTTIASENDAATAWSAYYHRQYSVARDYCSNGESIDAKLLCLRFTANEADVKMAVKALNQLLNAYGDNAQVQYEAGSLWKTIGRREGIFSRKSYLEKSVAAYKKAAELAPTNGRYLQEGASAQAYNGSFFSVDLTAHRRFIDKMKDGDRRYYVMAEMDYAQNSQDKSLANKWIAEARNKFPTDIDVIERSAQLLWTNDQVEQAQQTFHAVCELNPGEDHLWEKWLSSCEISAMLAQKEDASLAIGLASSQRIVDLDSVHDDYYADNLLVHAELLSRAGQKAKAITVLNQLLQLPASPDTISAAKKALKKS